MSGASEVRRAPKKARPTSAEDVVLGKLQRAGEVPSATQQPKSASYTLTLKEISTDKITQLANTHWGAIPDTARATDSASEGPQAPTRPPFSPDLVATIYNEELGGAGEAGPALKRVMLLEVSQYLERYLWPNFDPATATFEHVMSILLMVNEKFRGGVPAWDTFHTRPDVFGPFFKAFLGLKAPQEGTGGVGRELRLHERTTYLIFTINIFQSLEDEMVRGQVLRLVSLPLWTVLSPGRLQLELHALPALAKHWKSLTKKEAKAAKQPGYIPPPQRPEVSFLPSLLGEFLEALELAAPGGQSGALDAGALAYCERLLALLVDLLTQLPTRRFVRTLLDDRAVLVKARLAPLYRHSDAGLYRQLVDLFQFYMAFPINDHTGEPLRDEDVTAAHYEKVCQLQRLLFKHWPELRELALMNCGALEQRAYLKRALAPLTPDQLRRLVVTQLRLVADDDAWAAQTSFLMEVMLSTFERRRSQREVLNEIPVYPTESVMWDESQIPSVNYTGEGCLALPKLNLQFLTTHDYLMRNFHLFRLEATYEIREDIADVLGRVGAYWDEAAEPPVVRFGGWARMALPLSSFHITQVRKPNVGELKPAAVTADVVVDTRGLRGDVRGEWDELKQHDVLFLLTIRPPSGLDTAAALGGAQQDGKKVSTAEKYGLVYVRGCEVIEVKDEGGKLMNDFTGRVRREEAKPPSGTQRTLTVALDTAQYQLDVTHLAKVKGAEDPYATFNLLVRRKAKENNFKAVLESIRDIMNEAVVVPPWLLDILLGYGDPGAAQWQALPPERLLRTVDFKDTFLDSQHVLDSFPAYDVTFKPAPGQPKPLPPYRITFPDQPPAAGDGAVAAHTNGATNGSHAPARPNLTVQSYVPANPGPYPQDVPPTNTVRFTPRQVEAIMAGVQPGLTMVVGPPGTGKTDTAVQVMHCLYHNCPSQRTLVIAHSNQALNDLFAKILERDVPARYLLRLGMGEQELDTAQDFSRVGRVNAMLARRLELLAQVERMARQFGVAEDVAYTCETAGYFWLLHVLARWEKFSAAVARTTDPAAVAQLFPFTEFFSDAPQPLFKQRSYEEDMEVATGCFRHLKTLFTELEECRAFELFKGQADRVNYLMNKQAKIVAMTCTHAALKRREFLDLGFRYDNLLMEEAGQILEVETFIPLLLQKPEDGATRLKRVILIGDHHQLPPVVQNMAIQKYSRLDQPLFTRFIRLGTPYVQLNAQGRARPSLAALYGWRYQGLGDLPAVTTAPAFVTANPGLAFDYQFINVPDFMGRGESEASPFYYQNLGEAEYVVALYSFMRLLGYPATSISILTTYNGQKDLIKDVIRRRCANNPLFGWPAKVATVDKYQGQQNDYVLLSLVRTRVVGHLRDVRRLVVAMSRARLGLYVFGRQDLFGNCYELQPTFKLLLARPTQLALVKGEGYGACTRGVEDTAPHDVVPGVEAMMDLVARFVYEQQAAAYAAAAETAAETAEETAVEGATEGHAMQVDAVGGGTSEGGGVLPQKRAAEGPPEAADGGPAAAAEQQDAAADAGVGEGGG